MSERPHARYCQECHNRPNDILSSDEMCTSCKEGRTQIVIVGFILVSLLALGTYYLRIDTEEIALIDNGLFRVCMLASWAMGVFSFLNQRLTDRAMNWVIATTMIGVLLLFILCTHFQPEIGVWLSQVWTTSLISSK